MPDCTFRLLPLLLILLHMTACGTLAATGSHRDSTQYGFEDQADNYSDAGISASIRRQLIKDPGISASQIEVRTEQGTVTLHGRVSNQAMADRVIKLCRETEGVKQVKSYLSVMAP